jgi:hypothetical protein
MNEKLKQCCHRLKEEMKTAESCLADVGEHLAAVTDEKVEGLETRWKKSLTKCEAKRAQARGASERVRQFLQEGAAEVASKYEDWKTDREIQKLEKHADKLEDRAVDAVVIAASALLEAEVAIVEALKARKTAIEVAG